MRMALLDNVVDHQVLYEMSSMTRMWRSAFKKGGYFGHQQPNRIREHRLCKVRTPKACKTILQNLMILFVHKLLSRELLIIIIVLEAEVLQGPSLTTRQQAPAGDRCLARNSFARGSLRQGTR